MTLSPAQLTTLMNVYTGSTTDHDESIILSLTESKLVDSNAKGDLKVIILENGISELIESELLKDFLEHYELQSPELIVIWSKWEDQLNDGLDYVECKALLKEVQAVGYTFDYYLQAEPFELVKTPAGW